MKKILKAGLTDQTLDIFIQDSSSTTGAGLTGLVFNTASLVCYYRRGATGSATALTLATQTVGGAHSDGGFVAIDGTNMPGMYRLDLSDAIVASGVTTVSMMLKGATNMAPLTIELQLVSVDLDDTVRMGLTAMPNVASGSAGAIVTSGTGTAQLSVSSGLVTLAAVTHTGAVIPTVTTLTGHTAQTGDSYALANGANGFVAIKGDTAAILVDTGTTLDGRIPAALVGGRMDSSVGAMANDVITAAAMAASASTEIRSLASGTSDSGTTTTMVDAARTEADTDYWDENHIIVFTSGAIIGQARVITGFAPATDTITFSPATTQAVGTETYEIWPVAAALRPTTHGRTLDVSAGGEAGVDWANVGGQTTAVTLSGTTVNDLTTKTDFRLSTTGVADVWAYVIEGTWTAVMYMRLFAAALAAKCSGMGTATGTFRDIDDTKNRIVVTQDADGNRTAFATKDGA